MKRRYEKPNKRLGEYVRTVLIIEGFPKTDLNDLPVFTNGIPALFCKTEKNKYNQENVTQLALFGKAPTDVWTVNKQTTIISYFFKPFAVASLFNITAKKYRLNNLTSAFGIHINTQHSKHN